MKKVLALILALALVFALAACGGKEDDSEKLNITDEDLVDILVNILDGKTGEMVTDTFSLASYAEGGNDPDALFGGWFNGYTLPEGSKAAVNMPMMGSIAHLVVLVQPGSGTAEDLLEDLEANANPRWQICVEADTVKSAINQGLVLFIMTDSSIVNADDVIDAFNS